MKTKQEIKDQKIFIYDLQSKEYKQVTATILTSFFAGQDAVLHKSINKTGWTVSDRLTGTKIASANTEREAQANALRILRKHKKERYFQAQILTIKRIYKEQCEIKAEKQRLLDKPRNPAPITDDLVLDLAKISVITTKDFE